MSSSRRLASLNPNAEEFLPVSFKSTFGSTSIANGAASSSASRALGKSVLPSQSSVPDSPEEESLEYWCQKLPDDIIPDFKEMAIEDDSKGINSIPFSSLALQDFNQTSRVSGSRFMPFVRDEPTAYTGKARQGLLSEQAFSGTTEMNPFDILASRFPGFASETLNEVYYTNGADLGRTIDMLKQLELQVGGGLNQSLNSKAMSAPNLGAMDLPGLSVQDGPSPLQGLSLYQTNSTIPSGPALDFSSAFSAKLPTTDGDIWKYERKGFADNTIGSSRRPNPLAISYNSAQERGTRGSTRAAPVWPDNADLSATELLEKARDHARIRNAFFDQARTAHMFGNITLAKDLSIKGQVHNMQMKDAHAQAQQAITIYRQGNQIVPELQGNNGRSHERLIDLHGMNINEALQILQHELAGLRTLARSTEQRVLMFIDVGTGQHARSRISSRLRGDIQRYLIEDEGLEYTEAQLGLLRVQVF